MRFLHRLGADDRARHGEMLAVKLHRVFGPNGFENGEKLIGARAALFLIGAGGFEFVRRPAETETGAQE